MIKFFLPILCAICLIFSGCGDDSGSKSAPTKEKTIIGVITHLNVSEIEYNELMKKLEKSYRPSKTNSPVEYKFFDKMNDMQMALESKQIDMLSTYQHVANYMLKQNDNKEILPTEKFLSDSFCFAVREGDTLLQRDLNKAIHKISADGTLSKLTKEYIIDLKSDASLPIVPITHIDGADTIKVAVTGDLPPFDMILADGTPAGFSTAVLAEISKRMGKNIELIRIDSTARAAILSSKGADVVFWVAVPKDSMLIPTNIDQPVGIAISDPYYHDNIVHIGLK